MTRRRLVVWVLPLALATACASTPRPRELTISQDVVVWLDGPSDRSPLRGPSARLAAAGRAVREGLGHPLRIAIDEAVSPEHRDGLDAALTEAFEELATRLERWKKSDPNAFRLSTERLEQIVVRYAPGASDAEARAHFEGARTVVVVKRRAGGPVVPMAEVLALLEQTASSDREEGFASLDPSRVPPARQVDYVRWLEGRFDARGGSPESQRARALDRVSRATSFAKSGPAPEAYAAVVRYLVHGELDGLAWGHRGDDELARRAKAAMAEWLERDFARLEPASRERALQVLLTPATTDPRLREAAFRLSMRTIDGWIAAGHPVQSLQKRLPAEFELVVCPHPKDEKGHRTLGPRCDGGIVRLLLSSDEGTKRLGELLARLKDPVLLEHVLVNARSSRNHGDDRKAFALLRAVETEPRLLHAGLVVLAEEGAESGDPAIWLAELRRLWLTHEEVHGAILYALAHLDRYRSGKVDFDDFAGDFGAKVSERDARSFLSVSDESIALLPVVMPAFASGFSRAALLEPRLDAFLNDEGARRFGSRAPYAALVEIRHRLCDEAADADLRALSRYFATKVAQFPGKGLDSMSKTYDPASCDPPCAESRNGVCIRRKAKPR